jgi:hypothetical protein
MSKYKILPVKIDSKKSDKWKKVPEFLPVHPFLILQNAPPKSGKSNLLVNLLFNENFNWFDKFDKIVWLSPLIYGDKTTQPVMKMMEDENSEASEKISIFSGDDLEDINSIIKAIEEYQKEHPESETLLILDDCLGKMRNGEFSKLCAKYRHYNMSVIAISQQFKAFDPTSRNCASGFILFKTFNDKELENMTTELNGIPNFLEMYNKATAKKHNFLWINIDNQSVWHNFEQELWNRDKMEDNNIEDDRKFYESIRGEKKKK